MKKGKKEQKQELKKLVARTLGELFAGLAKGLKASSKRTYTGKRRGRPRKITSSPVPETEVQSQEPVAA